MHVLLLSTHLLTQTHIHTHTHTHTHTPPPHTTLPHQIADDNDLNQARLALQTTSGFLKQLQTVADARGVPAFELLQARPKTRT